MRSKRKHPALCPVCNRLVHSDTTLCDRCLHLRSTCPHITSAFIQHQRATTQQRLAVGLGALSGLLALVLLYCAVGVSP